MFFINKRILLYSFYIVLIFWISTGTVISAMLLTYSSDDLRSFNRVGESPPRPTRKVLFKLRLWRPCTERQSQLGSSLNDDVLRSSPFGSSAATPTTRIPVRPASRPACDSIHLCFATVNIQSINNKTHVVQELINDNDLDVLTVTETWHTSGEDLSLRRAAPPGYGILDAPRAIPDEDASSKKSLKTNHGGIAIFFRDHFSARKLDLGFKPSTFEVLACSLHSLSTTIIHLIIYRPSNKNNPVNNLFFEELTTLFETMATYQSEIIISGDLNIHVDNLNDRHGQRLLELLDSFDLVQNVSGPTHRAGHTLDLVITRHDAIPIRCWADPPVHSDHGIVFCNFPPIKYAPYNSSKKTVRQWKRLDKDAFRKALADSVLCTNTEELSVKSSKELFDMYDGTVRRIVDVLLPEINIYVKERRIAAWFDNDCRIMRRQTRMFERRYRHTRSATDCQCWVRSLEKKRDMFRAKEEAYWNARIVSNAGKPKKLWRCLNNLLMRNQSKVKSSTSNITAAGLSTFFNDKVDAVRDSTSDADPPSFNRLTEETFDAFEACSMEEVRRTVMQSPPKSCSLDPLPTFILREYIDELLPFLWIMCNASLREGHLPDSQKSAIITPGLKKSNLDPEQLKNYRPISNLTFISKVVERIVARQLNDYLQQHKLLPTLQSAYRRGHSTETALLKIISDILDAADTAHVTLLGMLDLSAAFDTVDHEILLTRLKISYGMSGKVLDWIASFVGGRDQFVTFAGGCSLATKLRFGIPQGSVLGPILFLLYTADVIEIALSLGLKVHSYADDTQLYLSCPSSNEVAAVAQLANCIGQIEKWMRSNRLKLNSEKTQFMWLGSRQQLAKITVTSLDLDGTEIEFVTSAKNLGVIFDAELAMDAHSSNVARSCFYQLRQLRSARRSLTEEAAKTLVHAFITSRVDFCNSIYYGVTDIIARKLQSILNAAARLITGKRRFDHITSVMRDELHWLPIRSRVVYKLAVLVYGCLHGLSPPYLSSMCIPVETIDGRARLRSAQHGDLLVPRTRTKRFGPRSFRVSGPAVWNSLPLDIRDTQLTFDQFQRKLKTHLFTIAYGL